MRGKAFEFRSRYGSVVGRFIVGNGGNDKRPFTTNATGVATGLNADRLDGLDAADIFRISRQGVLALVRENFDPSRFLPATGKAVDSDLLDGLDATAFLPRSGKAADSELLDGLDSSAFLLAGQQAIDADRLDGRDSSAFLRSDLVMAMPGGRAELDIGEGQDLIDENGLRIHAECTDAGGGVPELELTLDTDEDNTMAYASGGGVDGPAVAVNAAGTGSLIVLDQTGAGQLVTVDLTTSKPGGLDVTGTFNVGFSIHGADCTSAGTLLATS